MTKKILQMAIVLILSLNLTPLASAEETDPTLISDLVYNKETHTLTGKTAPDATVSLADIVGTIPVDEEGNFSVPIPDNLETTTINIMDVINDKSADVNFDFITGEIATQEPAAAPPTSESESTSSSSSAPTSQSVTENQQESSPKKDTSLLFWLLILVVIIILTILGLFLYHRKKRQLREEKERARKKTKRSRRRKRRKKSTH